MKLNTKSNHLKLFILRFLIVPIPYFLVAYLFEKITLVVPTVVSALIVGNGLDKQNADYTDENYGETTD